MKKVLLYSLAVGVLLLNACKKDVDPPIELSNTEEVSLSIMPNFAGEALALNQEFVNELNYRVNFSDLKFYLGDIRLIKADGSFEELSEVEFYSAALNMMTKTYTAPKGSYSGIEYSWGVPERLGGTDNPDFDATAFPVGHPLNLDYGMYWAWNSGYRFSEVEGRYNVDAQSTDPLLNTFTYHPGTQTLYRTLTVDMPFVLDGVNSTDIHIDLDLSKIWYNDTDTLDCADPMQNDLAGGNVMTLGVKYIELFMGAVDHSVSN